MKRNMSLCLSFSPHKREGVDELQDKWPWHFGQSPDRRHKNKPCKDDLQTLIRPKRNLNGEQTGVKWGEKCWVCAVGYFLDDFDCSSVIRVRVCLMFALLAQSRGLVFLPAVYMQTGSIFHRKHNENHRKGKLAWNGWGKMMTQLRMKLYTNQSLEQTQHLSDWQCGQVCIQGKWTKVDWLRLTIVLCGSLISQRWARTSAGSPGQAPGYGLYDSGGLTAQCRRCVWMCMCVCVGGAVCQDSFCAAIKTKSHTYRF